MKSLVIVESPAKAKTLGKILGSDFKVKASIGHIKDLPQKELGVDVDNGFTPEYVVIPGKEKIIKELKAESKSAKAIYLATDPDREGEAIAYHISEEIVGKKKTNDKAIYRVTFHEITERAVKEAIKNPSQIDINKVDAQQARRVLDRLVGYKLSPYLWKKVRRGLSAGRVQSVAVRLVVDREREIESFVSEEYWTLDGMFVPVEVDEQRPFKASLYKYKGKLLVDREAEGQDRFLIRNEETANEVRDALIAQSYVLNAVEKKVRRRLPSPPFITSTLQQEASIKLKFPAKKTMLIAQQLYEGLELGQEGSVGLITYMRTDSYRIAPEAEQWARDFIKSRFGKDYVPEAIPRYRSKDTAQDAHEAIRPTYRDKTPEKVKPFLTKDQYNLYKLIWNRFIASQMAPAIYDQTTFIIRPTGDDLAETEFRSTGSILRFPGFLALYKDAKEEDPEEESDSLLPDLSEGSPLKVLEIEKNQHFTQPPPRYTEATLVKALEDKGIGRPSTYATIISTIQDRKYVVKEEGRFKPTELGVVVNDLLVDKFPELIDLQFTAKMEEELDEIEQAKLKWVDVIQEFYSRFESDLRLAFSDNGRVRPQDIPTEETCERCGKPMVIRWGRNGRFYACTGYPECKNTRPLESKKTDAEATDQTCEKCGASMVIKTSRYGRFLACSNYPECKNTKPLTTGLKCPVDNGDIIERKTKRGTLFWTCSNYPDCKFASWDRPINENCPQCNSAVLFQKVSKRGYNTVYCYNKECGYKRTEPYQ